MTNLGHTTVGLSVVEYDTSFTHFRKSIKPKGEYRSL